MLKLPRLFSLVFLSVVLTYVSAPSSYANPNSSACKKVKTSVKKLDDRNLSTWRKFDAIRDGMAGLNFSNTDYKKSLSLLKSVYKSDLDMFNMVSRNSQCYPSQTLENVSASYDQTIASLSSLNTIISNSNQNSEVKFNTLKETIWLWIAGEYISYYTLDGKKFS